MSTAVPAVVTHIGSRRIVAPLLGDTASFRRRCDWICQELTDQLAEALADRRDEPTLHFICSTVLTKLVSGRPRQVAALCEAIETRTGVRTRGLVQAYQCAGWGYALRFVMRHAAQRRVLLSIVDADLHDMMGRGYEAVIGKIGYGLTTVGIELSEASVAPTCEGPFANHGVTELLHVLRAQHRRHGALPTFMPFLPEALDGLARRMLGAAMAPNRHDHYGHAFGSDPWIGLAEWLLREPPSIEREVLLGAFAYDGYCTMARLRVGPGTRVRMRPDLVPVNPATRYPS